jgi:hypothetical protein
MQSDGMVAILFLSKIEYFFSSFKATAESWCLVSRHAGLLSLKGVGADLKRSGVKTNLLPML